MAMLRELLDNPQFNAMLREIKAEARRLGFKPVDAFLASPVAKHNKLRRNRCLSRKGHAKGKVSTEVVPGRGPQKYRMRLIQADVMPMISRLQRLTWDAKGPPPTNGMCICKWSESKPCKRCR